MVAPPKPQRIPLSAAVDRYLDSATAQVTVGRIQRATRDNYANDLHALVDILGGSIITDDIAGEDIDRAVGTYGAGKDKRYTRTEKDGPGRSVATQKRFYESVSRFFTHAAMHGWVQVSPMPWATLKPTVRGDLRTERTALSSEQARALLEHGAGAPAAEGDEKTRSHERNYSRDKLLLTLMLVLGPRVSEVVGANRQDIMKGDTQTEWRILGKGGKVRRVPLSDEMVDLINTYLADRPAPPQRLSPKARADAEKALFRTGRGSRLSARDIQRLMHRAAAHVLAAEPEQARDVTPHALRHTAATLMLATGWDVKVVSQLLGHANISATQRYLDAIPGELAAAIRSNPLLMRVVPQPDNGTEGTGYAALAEAADAEDDAFAAATRARRTAREPIRAS